MKSVIASTLRAPPNSSTVGAKMIKWLYKYSPYFDSKRFASSASLNVSVYPLSGIKYY